MAANFWVPVIELMNLRSSQATDSRVNVNAPAINDRLDLAKSDDRKAT
jgi:hypothetical protein